MGVPVYRKVGFEEVGRLEIGLEELGGAHGEVHVHGELFLRGLSWEGNVRRVADLNESVVAMIRKPGGNAGGS
jgi:hypothetical protein